MYICTYILQIRRVYAARWHEGIPAALVSMIESPLPDSIQECMDSKRPLFLLILNALSRERKRIRNKLAKRKARPVDSYGPDALDHDIVDEYD